VLELLCAKGVVVNAKSPKGWTPLMSAASEAWYEGVEFLLEHGADPLATDKRDGTALSEAEFALHTFERRGDEPERVQEAHRVVALLKQYEERKR